MTNETHTARILYFTSNALTISVIWIKTWNAPTQSKRARIRSTLFWMHLFRSRAGRCADNASERDQIEKNHQFSGGSMWTTRLVKNARPNILWCIVCARFVIYSLLGFDLHSFICLKIVRFSFSTISSICCDAQLIAGRLGTRRSARQFFAAAQRSSVYAAHVLNALSEINIGPSATVRSPLSACQIWSVEELANAHCSFNSSE